MCQERSRRLLNNILFTIGQLKPRAGDANVTTGNQLNIKPVKQVDPLHEHCELMIAIVPFSQDMQTKIHFGWCEHRFFY
jgi:hypothetical protein